MTGAIAPRCFGVPSSGGLANNLHACSRLSFQQTGQLRGREALLPVGAPMQLLLQLMTRQLSEEPVEDFHLTDGEPPMTYSSPLLKDHESYTPTISLG